jgi:hypothetical protein
VAFLVRDRKGDVNLERIDRPLDASLEDEVVGETSEYMLLFVVDAKSRWKVKCLPRDS